MFGLPPSVRILACTEPVDLRKSFNGLPAVVRSVMGENPLDGHLFVFFNRRSTQVRLLYWDRNGYCIVGKRLEKGKFKTPWSDKLCGLKWQLEGGELALILDGLDLGRARRRTRWTPPRQRGVKA